MCRLLLLLYPSPFRAEYGEEMCRDFARKRQRASGCFALAVLWMVAIGDAIRNGLAAHCDLLRQDVRSANRTIRRASGFSATVVLVARCTMQSLLAGLNPGDAATFATAMALAVMLTLAGSLIPTVRAVRVDPAVAVRAE